jgi:hypothetical protein
MSTRITLRMVANKAGVSQATASLVLSGARRVSAETHDRVARAAHDLGYVRDLYMASLAGGRFRHQGKPIVIAVCIDQASWLEPFRCQASGMGMSLYPIPNDMSNMQAAAHEARASAIVLNLRGIDQAVVSTLTTPTVLWEDESPDELVVDVIETHEWWASVRGALLRLRTAGYRRPGVVLTPAQPRHWHDDARLAAARSLGACVLETSHSDSDLLHFIESERPDVLLGTVTWSYSALHRLGIRMPFAAMIISQEESFNGMTGWVTDQQGRGRTTLEMIEQRLRYGARSPRRTIIPPTWRVGKSLHT